MTSPSSNLKSFVLANTITDDKTGGSYRILPSLNASLLYGFNLGNGLIESMNGTIMVDSSKVAMIDSQTGKINAELIPGDIIASNPGIERIVDDDARQELTPTDSTLYFVESTKIIWYFYDNKWYYVSGMASGGVTQTISVNVDTSKNEITANLRISNSNLSGLFSSDTTGLKFNVSALGLSNFAEKNKIERYGQTGLGLSKNDFNNDYKLLLDNLDSNITSVIPYASSSVPGLVKIGTGLSISQDGVLSVGGTDITNSVYSVNGQTGDVVITKESLSIENVDNTSDKNKPVSDAAWVELNKKIVDLKYIANSRKIQIKKGEYTENEGNGSYSNTFVDCITLSGFLTDIEMVAATENARAYYKFKKDGSDLPVTIQAPDNIVSGTFNTETSNLVFTTETGASISIYLPLLTNTYTVGNTDTLTLSKDSENNITGAVKISNRAGNIITKDGNDGLYAEVNLDNYIVQEDLEGYVTTEEYGLNRHTHPNKNVIDRFGLNQNNELTYNNNVLQVVKVFSEQIDFEQGSENIIWELDDEVATVIHNLGTSNIISCILIDENNKTYNLSPVIKDSNTVSIRIPEFLNESELTLKITGV